MSLNFFVRNNNVWNDQDINDLIEKVEAIISNRFMSSYNICIGSSSGTTSFIASVLFLASISFSTALIQLHKMQPSLLNKNGNKHILGSITTLLRTSMFGTSSSSSSAVELGPQVVQRHNVTQLPHNTNIPTWKIGSNQPSPYVDASTSGTKSQQFASFTTKEVQAAGGMYNLLISSIVPRPIALLSTQDATGIHNCAPFSYFNIMCHDPPLVSIGICTNGRQRLKKDSLRNIESTGEFVVNIMSSWFVESANHCSGNFDADVDEMQVAGLTVLPSDMVKSSRVGESAVQFECKTEYMNEIKNDAGEHTCTIVTGRIVKIHIQKGVLTTESVDTNKPVVDWTKLQVLGRLGGNTYTNVMDGFDLLRPSGKV